MFAEILRYLDSIWVVVRGILDTPLLKMGGHPLLLGALLQSVILFVVLFWASEKIRGWLVNRVLKSRLSDPGHRYAIGSIGRGVFLIFGGLFILQSSGIKLTSLNVLAGTIGLGLGLGLQELARNVASGITLLMERPVKVGDLVEVSGQMGFIEEVNMRSSIVRTNNGVAIVVPNAVLLERELHNFSYFPGGHRVSVAVGVAYGSDLSQVRQLLVDAAEACDDVLRERPVDVLLKEYADSSINFEIRVWTESLAHDPDTLRSHLLFDVGERFEAAQIEIPFPQHDIHIRTNNTEASLPAPRPSNGRQQVRME